MDKIFVTDYPEIVYTFASYSFAISNLYGRGNTKILHADDWDGIGNFTDADTDTWDITWGGTCTGKVWRKCTFDLTTTANSTIEISYYGQGGGTIYSATDSDGVLTTQTISKEFYNQTGGDTPYSFEPLHLKISKDGFQTYEANFTLTQKTNWEIYLQTLPTTDNMPLGFAPAFLLGIMIVLPIAIFIGRKH
jgi:hypothetical protein